MKIPLFIVPVIWYRYPIFLGFIFFIFHYSHGQCPPGDVNLNSQNAVDQFIANYPNCTEIEGDLYIRGFITDFSGLDKIKSVGDSLYLRLATPAEYSVEVNLSGLTSIGTDFICFQNHVEAIDLSNLKSIGRNLEFYQNDMAYINLERLFYIGGGMEVYQNFLAPYSTFTPPDLHFEELAQVDGDISFYQNKIKSIGCSNLDTIRGSFEVYQNDSLANLYLDSLNTVIGDVTISGTDLSDLNTFQKLLQVGGDLQITFNSFLTDCSGICPLLNTDGVDGNISIAHNPFACNSESEVSSSCIVGIEGAEKDAQNLKLFPNPTRGKLHLNNASNGTLVFYDLLGRYITEYPITANQPTVDIYNLPNGYYFVELLSKNGSVLGVQKIIKSD